MSQVSGGSGGGGGTGDVVGPASSTDNAIVRFDGTTGKLIQNSGVIISDTDRVAFVAGLIGTPSVYFGGDTTSGFYRNASNELSWSSAGVRILGFTGGGLTVLDPVTPSNFAAHSVATENYRLTGSGSVRDYNFIASSSTSVNLTIENSESNAGYWSWLALGSGDAQQRGGLYLRNLRTSGFPLYFSPLNRTSIGPQGTQNSIVTLTVQPRTDQTNIGGTTTANASTTITHGSGTGFATDFRRTVGIGDRIALSSATSTYSTVTAIGAADSLTVDFALGDGSSQTINLKHCIQRWDDSSGNVKAVINDQGRVALGNVFSPQSLLHIDAGTATASELRFTAGTTTGRTSTDGFQVGITTAGVAEIRQRESQDILFYTNNTQRARVKSTGGLLFGDGTDPGGYFTFYRNAGTLTASDTNFLNSFTATPSTATIVFGGLFSSNINPATGSSSICVGNNFSFAPVDTSTRATTALGLGNLFECFIQDGADWSAAYGVSLLFEHAGTGTIDDGVGGTFSISVSGSGTMTNACSGLFAEPLLTGGGTLTNTVAACIAGNLSITRTDVATTATINALSNASSAIKFTGSTATTVNGISGGWDTAATGFTGHKLKWWFNESTALVSLTNENASASAANRIQTPRGGTVPYYPGEGGFAYYDANQSRWLVPDSRHIISLEVNTTDVGNVGTGEDDLMTYSLPADYLASDDDYIEITAWGITAANANNKTIKAYFGATQCITTTALALNATDWEITWRIVRTGATTQDSICKFASNSALLVTTVDFTNPAETLSGAVTIKLTGEATADNDIIQKGWIIRWGRGV